MLKFLAKSEGIF